MDTNYWTKEAHQVAPHNRSNNLDTHRATWSMFRRSNSRASHLTLRDNCIASAQECDRLYQAAYKVAALEYGESGPWKGIEGTPRVSGSVWVSGGTWSHWPDSVKTAVATFSRMRCAWMDHAYDHHRAAGNRAHTFRALYGRNIEN